MKVFRQPDWDWRRPDLEIPAAVLSVIITEKEMLERQDRITRQVIEETGKTETEAFGMEVFASCDALSYYARNAAKFIKISRQYGMTRGQGCRSNNQIVCANGFATASEGSLKNNFTV